ncbi:MAG TPA: hypothetical protein VIQ31_18605, partial [Phormidium sp.]
MKIHKYVNAIAGKQSLAFMTILRSYGLCALSPETRFLHIFLLTQPFIFVETRNKRPHAIANRLSYTVMFICTFLFIAVRS